MRRVVAVVAVLLLVSGCARSGPQSDLGACTDAAGGDGSFPIETVDDWVTYGDHLVTARVQPRSEGGWVDLVPVATLWSRPEAPARPLSVRAWSDGDRASAEGVDLIAGHTYLALLTWRHPAGEPAEWLAMDSLSFDDGIVGNGPDQCWPAGHRPAREQLWGKNGAGVRQVLSSAEPDPLAKPYARLDPGERYQLVAAARR